MSTVFFDVDTQLDFLYPAGALYVPGAESIVPQVAALNRYAAKNGIPVVSTMDAHTENDPEFREWPPHCVAGTAGQQKPAATLLEPRTTIRSAPQEFDARGAQQICAYQQPHRLADRGTADVQLPCQVRLGADAVTGLERP